MDAEGRLPIERELRRRLEALGPTSRAELLVLLALPDKDRAARIGMLYREPRMPTLAELLVDLEEDQAARAIVMAELRMMGLGPPP